MHRSIKVKIVKETANKITLQLMSLNRKMPVTRQDFKERVEMGVYDVLNPEVLDDK